MLTTSPYHTESSIAYRDLQESWSALRIPADATSTQAKEERKGWFSDQVGDTLWRLSMVLAPYGACFTPGSGMNFRQSALLSPREKMDSECRLLGLP